MKYPRNRGEMMSMVERQADRHLTELEYWLCGGGRVQADLETARKADASDAVPLATIGLAVTALGTVVGLLGSVLAG